ncbi:MAG: hypothetical protein WCT85_01000 [Parachlamydiales bacterium]|jgi:hypothetical protein
MSAVSNYFSKRNYMDFLRDAKIFSDSLDKPGSKISWGMGMVPDYDSPQLLQGLFRKIKDWMPFSVANRLQASQYAFDWAVALADKDISPTEKDSELFSLAQQAFLRQAELYKGEYEKYHEKNAKTASSNYCYAAQFLENVKIGQINRWLEESADAWNIEDLAISRGSVASNSTENAKSSSVHESEDIDEFLSVGVSEE